MSEIKACDLFKAYQEEKLPIEGGYIISSFLSKNSTYTIYDIVAYSNVKAIYFSGEGLTFQTDGNKIFVLSEPPSYARKYIEPFRRTGSEAIPQRFNELEIYTSKKQHKVMISRNPVMTYSSFTIIKPAGENFSYVFYNREDVMDNIRLFMEKTLSNDAGIHISECKKIAPIIVNGLSKFTIWQ